MTESIPPEHRERITFEELLKKAGFSSIAAIRTNLMEVCNDRGPSHYMACSYCANVEKAISDVEKILTVKKFFKQRIEQSSVLACVALRGILNELRATIVLISEFKEPRKSINSRSKNQGLIFDLGDTGMNRLRETSHNCRQWAQTYAPQHLALWLE